MIQALANAFRVPELRRKILFTLLMLAIYRFGAHVPVPGISPGAIKGLIEGQAALGLLNLFAGGALANFAVFSLGIMPYITASIIMTLLQGVVPVIERWSKEGETGRRKITQVTRYMTLGIGFVQAVSYLGLFQAPAPTGLGVVIPWPTRIVIVISLLAGTALVMWMGELITQRGIGNGMSLMIFASIISTFPQALVSTIITGTQQRYIMVAVLLLMFLLVVAAIVVMERGQRRIPVQYAKRVVGRKVYGGSGTYIPFKINGANVIPIIFAASVLFFPAQIAIMLPNVLWLQKVANSISGGWMYYVFFPLLVVVFTYFYTALIFNPIDLADNLRKNGGFIPGVRPGKATVNYIENVLNRITLPGALFLALIAIGPTALFRVTEVPLFEDFGGTSLLIMVGVALETMTQLESQLKMRHYDGFFK